MRIERQNERGSTLDDPGAGMRMTVDSTLVPFGAAEESLKGEVVARERRVVAPGEQPFLKRAHHFRHMDADRIGVLREFCGQCLESLFAFFRGVVRGVERGIDFTQGFDVPGNFVELIADERDAAVYAPSEGAQRLFALFAPPFLRPPAVVVALSMESRISPSPFAMRTPGGESGPPWSSFSTPRTAAQ